MAQVEKCGTAEQFDCPLLIPLGIGTSAFFWRGSELKERGRILDEGCACEVRGLIQFFAAEEVEVWTAEVIQPVKTW